MPVSNAPALKPEVAPLPPDEGLPGLPRLFDSAWVWQAFCDQFGLPEEIPERLRLRELLYRPGRRAVVGYVAERQWEHWVVEEEFAIELVADKPERLFRYPDDPYLPGLPQVASASEAQELLPRYVRLHPQRLRVETVRYRPATRAVLRHIAGWRRPSIDEVTLFVRVMPPARADRVLTAATLAERSGFVLPRLAGSWPEGGVIWLVGTPGETVRSLIRAGRPPHPEPILDALAQLWSSPLPTDAGRPLDLKAGFSWTRRVLSQVLQGDETRQTLQRVVDHLSPFVEAWQPSSLAHNDFYDDQLLLTPEGRLALVDFEEVGPGDPLVDVGNLLAHLRWMARFGIAPEACSAYHQSFRAAALQRFGWEAPALALREAFALFRLSSNPVRQLQRDWPRSVATGLALASETLDEAS